LREAINRQTDRQTNKQTNARYNITSLAEVKMTDATCILHW